jgi:hypothetical protein
MVYYKGNTVMNKKTAYQRAIDWFNMAEIHNYNGDWKRAEHCRTRAHRWMDTMLARAGYVKVEVR